MDDRVNDDDLFRAVELIPRSRSGRINSCVLPTGTRIMVTVILDNLADGLTEAEILSSDPTQKSKDIRAAIHDASDCLRLNEREPTSTEALQQTTDNKLLTTDQMIATVVVGYGLAGRAFHCPLIRRQPGLKLHGIVARDPEVRAQALSQWGNQVRGYAHLDEALADPDVQLVVIATPHDTHAGLAIRTLEARRHCVVDKVMALATAEADAMIEARDRSGCLLSVFHNRRWDWDYLTVREVLGCGELGRPLLFESSVCRYAPPRAWRGSLAAAGTILHDWGAHLVDQALQLGLGPCRRLTAWVTPGPWEAVDSGGHGRIVLEFDGVLFQVESSRICRLDRPRWWIVGTHGGFVKHGIDPQEDALRAGDIDAAFETRAHKGVLHTASADGSLCETPVATVRGHWDSYYRNIGEAIQGREELAVTAEQAREVVRVLDAAVQSSREHQVIEGPWGFIVASRVP